MGGGKGKAPPAPDYGPIASANAAAAKESAAIAREQLAWAREQYALDRQVTDRVLDVFLPAMEAEAAAGQRERARYEDVFQQMEDDLVAEAKSYDTPARREAEASRAMTDVHTAIEGQRRAALSGLASFGVDPSLARANALDASSRTQQGAISAAAANTARRTVEDTGRALRGEVVNIGKGYPSNIASAYGTAIEAGRSSVAGALDTTRTGAGTMGTGPEWYGASANILGNWGSQVAQMNAAAMSRQQRGSGVGAILGSALGLAMTSISPESAIGRIFT